MSNTSVFELALVALALSSTVWVLGIQAIGLLRSMPRARFLGLQMSLVRVWARALAGITAVVAALAVARAGLHHAWPAVVACGAALACALWAVPRALRSGGAAIRADEGEAMTSGGFLADGGGEVTRTWHRVVLACTAAVVAGLVFDAHTLLHGAERDHHDHEASAVTASAAQAGARVLLDRVTVENVGRLEREAAAVLAAGGAGDVTSLRAAWNRIFEQCTTQGEAHARLHVFLAPLVGVVARTGTGEETQRRDAVRELLRALGQFDATFAAAP